jgi:hypothetical protein
MQLLERQGRKGSRCSLCGAKTPPHLRSFLLLSVDVDVNFVNFVGRMLHMILVR